MTEGINSNDTGSQVFGSAWRQLHRAKAIAELHRLVDQLVSTDVTWSTMDVNAKALEERLKARNFGIDEIWAAPLSVPVPCRGKRALADVCRFIELWQQCKSRLDCLGVDLGILQPLWCDNQLVDQSRPIVRVKIEASILQHAKLVREAAAEAVEAGSGSADAVKAILTGNDRVYSSIDRNWRVGYCFWQSVM